MDEKKRVLIVDDDEGIRTMLALVFEEQGYETDTAASGRDALEKARLKFFNVALVDVRLLDGEGTALASALMELHPDMATIVITGYATTDTAIQALNQGITAYVKKPFDMDEVLILTKRALEKQHLAIENRRLYEEARRELTERRRMEEALRESEQRYRLLAENVSDVMWIMDLNWRCTYISPSITRQRGYDVEEAMQLTPEESLTPASLEVASKAVEEALTLDSGEQEAGLSAPELMELEHYCKDGSTIWTEVRAGFLRGEDGQPVGIVGVARDITERKQADEALRLSEERFRSLIENGSDGIVIVNAEGIIEYESPSFKRLLGRRPEDRVGGNAFLTVHPDDMFVAAEGFAEVVGKPGSSMRAEVRLEHGDGSWRTFEIVGRNLIDDAATGGIVANLRDVTERKAAEEALRSTEAHYRTLIENSLDAITILGEDGSIRYESPAYEHMLGFDPDDRGGGILERIHPDDAQRVAGTFETFVKDRGGVLRTEVRAQHKDGSWRHIEAVGNNLLDDPIVKGIVVNMRDITERKIAEEALKASEERYRLVVDNAIEAIVVAQKGVIRFLNPATTKMTGYNEEEVLGRPFEELIHPDDREIVHQRHAERLKGMQAPSEYGFRIFRRDGETRWVEINAARIMWDGESATMLFLRDVTEKRRADEERRVMEQQVQLAGRLVAVGELAAGVAHELNNPLAAVQAYAQLLKDRDDLDEGTKGDAATIYGEAQRASRITGNLLSFARSHRPEKSFVSLNEILQRSLELQAYHMRLNNIEVVLELAPDLPRTMADAHQMQQVFVNLVTNAEHAMTENGGGTLVLKTMRSGEMIDVTFTDDGPGIRQEDLRRIFDPFFTTKEVGKGTGLGLSICYGIVREHGGRITAHNNRNRGATFVVQLPIVREGEAGDGPVESGIAVGSAFPREPGN